MTASSNDGHHAGSTGVTALVLVTAAASVPAAVAFAAEQQYVASFFAVGLLPLALVVRRLGLLALLRFGWTGWLYMATIVMTTVAPALGTTGTAARLALAGIGLVAVIIAKRDTYSMPPPAILCTLLILLIALIGSTIAAPTAWYGIARLLNWVMFLPLAYLVYLRPNIRSLGLGTVLAGTLQMVGVGLQVLGIIPGTWGGILTSGTTYNPVSDNHLIRYTGFILNPNNLALLLVLGIVALLAALFSAVPIAAKITSVGLIGLFVVGIVLSGSRGGIAALGIATVLVLVRLGRRGLVVLIAITAACTAAVQLVSTQALTVVLNSFNSIFSGDDTSALARLDVWQERIAANGVGSIVFGTGFGGYAPWLFTNQHGIDIDPDAAREATVDNGWLKLLLESGLVGVVALGVLLIIPLLSAYLISTGQARITGAAAAAGLAAMVWRSTSVDMLDQNPWNAILFMTTAAALAIRASAASQVVPAQPAPLNRSESIA